jgi:hypothetical protein
MAEPRGTGEACCPADPRIAKLGAMVMALEGDTNRDPYPYKCLRQQKIQPRENLHMKIRRRFPYRMVPLEVQNKGLRCVYSKTYRRDERQWQLVQKE